MISHPVPPSDLELQLKLELKVVVCLVRAADGTISSLEPEFIEEHLFTL